MVAANRISEQLDMQDQLQFRTCDASSDQFNEEQVKQCRKRYNNIPEEFYTMTGFQVATPTVCEIS